MHDLSDNPRPNRWRAAEIMLFGDSQKNRGSLVWSWDLYETGGNRDIRISVEVRSQMIRTIARNSSGSGNQRVQTGQDAVTSWKLESTRRCHPHHGIPLRPKSNGFRVPSRGTGLRNQRCRKIREGEYVVQWREAGSVGNPRFGCD